MKRKAGILLKCGAVIGIFLVLVIIVTGGFFYKTQDQLYNKGKEVSPNGKFQILFQQIGQPDWPFGATAVRITVQNIESNKIVETIQTNIQDDGASLRKENWEILWQEKNVAIILRGSEQKDKVFILKLEPI